MKIIINPETLKNLFPYFANVSNEAIINASLGVGSYISTTIGEINLDKDLQIRGNYLACCHILYMSLNPSIGQGIVSNVSQGAEGLGYQERPVKNLFEYQLGLSSYGLELLSILNQIQAPTIKKPTNIYPYYNGIRNGF